MDVVIHSDGTATQHPGGSPANVAVALGRLGHRPTLLTRIGDDASTSTIVQWLDASGVQLHSSSVGSGRTSRAIAYLNAEGSARYDIDLTWDLPRVADENIDLLHIGSISATLAPGGAQISRLVKSARQRAVISYDPNVRPALIGDRETSRSDIENLIALSDVVKVSDEDLEWLHPGRTPDDVARTWLAAGVSIVVVTRGGAGAVGFTSSVTVVVDAPRVQVADTVGAGDTLMGAFLAALIDLEIVSKSSVETARRTLTEMPRATLHRILSYAVGAAAVTVSRVGADPPTLDDMATLGISAS